MTENLELTRKVAFDPCTAPDVLGELGRSSDRITRQNVAANPNSPTEVLLKLGEEFPEQLLENPIFSLLLLENPNLIAEIPYNTLLSLLKCETVPVSFLEWGPNNPTGDRNILLALAMNAKTPRHILEKLLQNQSYPDLQEAVQLHVNFAGEMTELWDRPAIEAIRNTTQNIQKFGRYLEQLAKINSMPEFLIPIWELVTKTLPLSDTSFQQTANNTKTPVKALSPLATDNDVRVRRLVASNPNTPVNILSQLATDNDDSVRCYVAKNPNTPVNILSQLTKDNNAGVRLHVAFNPNVPVNILSQLATDNNAGIRGCVAKNPKTPVDILSQLATDDDVGVREKVVKNPHIPMSLLEQLLSDRSEKVRQFAVARYLAHNPDKLSFVLQHYPKDSQPGFSRSVILFQPQVTTNLLVKNSRSLIWLERFAIAQNLNTPLKTLQILARDGNRIVRAAAKANIHSSHNLA